MAHKKKAKPIITKPKTTEKPKTNEPIYKELFREILTWTREQKTSWYKGFENDEFVRYTLQGKDGYKIHLLRYKNKRYGSEYEFINFRGIFTHSEFQELEIAILAAGFRKPSLPDNNKEVREKEEECRNKLLQEKRRIQRQQEQEREKLRETQLNSSSVNQKIDQQQAVVSGKSFSHNSQKAERKAYRERVKRELSKALLEVYTVQNHEKKYGIEILAKDTSGKTLNSLAGRAIPASVYEFAKSAAAILPLINKKRLTGPACKDVYTQLIQVYSERVGGDANIFGKKTIRDFRNKLINNVADRSGNGNTITGSAGARNKRTLPRRSVNVRDFVIRTSVLSCMYRNHNITNVDAVIKTVDNQGDITDTVVPAGYCQQCQKFFILDTDYKQLTVYGEPLCTVVEEQNYKKNYKNDRYFTEISAWPEKSILRKCGYNVSQTEGLTTIERRKRLANIIDQEILSKIEIRSHIRKQIAFHERHLQAVDKWESDDDFVAAYNKGYYAKYGVEKLRKL